MEERMLWNQEAKYLRRTKRKRSVNLLVWGMLVCLMVLSGGVRAMQLDSTLVDSSEALVDSLYADAQEPDSVAVGIGKGSSLKWYTMFERIPNDWARYWNLTVRVEKIPAWIAMAALTAATIVTDQPVYEVGDRWYQSSRTVKDVTEFFVYIGDGKPQFGLAAAFGAYGFFAKDERALRTASQITEAILACGGVVQLLKHITGRESPLVSTRTNGRWVFFPNQIEYHKKVPHYDAFPSGHIATALATLIVVLENYPEIASWLRPIGYTVVGLIGVGMVNNGIHWWSDYPLGLALGYQFGMIAAHPEGLESETRPNGGAKFSIAPEINPIRNGIRLSLNF